MSGNSNGGEHNTTYGSSANKLVTSHVSTGADDEEQSAGLVKTHKPQQDILRSIIPPYLCCYLYHGQRSGDRDAPDSSHGFSNSTDEDDDDADLDLTSSVPINTPWVVIQVVVGVWLLYAVCYLVMKDFSTCSVGYYIVLGVIYSLLVLQVVWGMQYLRAHQLEEPSSITEGDIHWSEHSSVLPVVAFFVGILTTLLGIGGGELMGPLLLMAKVLPQVSSATTSIMSLLNSSSSILHYMLLGEVPLYYALLTFLIGSAGGLSGRVG
eukprot:gene37085-45751_t